MSPGVAVTLACRAKPACGRKPGRNLRGLQALGPQPAPLSGAGRRSLESQPRLIVFLVGKRELSTEVFVFAMFFLGLS